MNALAAGLIAVSVIAFVGDPAPAQIGTPLPTYLGLRSAAEDARALMNLDLAMQAMEADRDDHGTFRGFDADEGTAAEPSLAWLDGPPSHEGNELRVQIVTADAHNASVAIPAREVTRSVSSGRKRAWPTARRIARVRPSAPPSPDAARRPGRMTRSACPTTRRCAPNSIRRRIRALLDGPGLCHADARQVEPRRLTRRWVRRRAARSPSSRAR